MAETNWLSSVEMMLYQELMNAEHNDWVRNNGHCGGDPNCMICNSMMKPTHIQGSIQESIKEEYFYTWKGERYTEQKFKTLIQNEYGNARTL